MKKGYLPFDLLDNNKQMFMFYVEFCVLFVSYVEEVICNRKAQLKVVTTLHKFHAHLQHPMLKSAWKLLIMLLFSQCRKKQSFSK